MFSSVPRQEDPVLLVPEDQEQKPYVAIIKVIALPGIAFLVLLPSTYFLVAYSQIMELLSMIGH